MFQFIFEKKAIKNAYWPVCDFFFGFSFGNLKFPKSGFYLFLFAMNKIIALFAFLETIFLMQAYISLKFESQQAYIRSNTVTYSEFIIYQLSTASRPVSGTWSPGLRVSGSRGRSLSSFQGCTTYKKNRNCCCCACRGGGRDTRP